MRQQFLWSPIIFTMILAACENTVPKIDLDKGSADADADADADDSHDPDADHDEDGVTAENDCDDDDPELGASADDIDCDGAQTDDDCDDEDPELGASADDSDCDGATTDEDCDDSDPDFGSSTDDPDCDGATTEEEVDAGSDPNHPDTDGDWVMDGQEIHGDRSPVNPERLVITLNKGEEATFHLVGRPGEQSTDVTFLLDTTCSMSSTATAMATEFVDMTDQLALVKMDIHYGFATFDDYAFASYGSAGAGDKPFILRQPVTDDVAAVQEALSTVPIHAGADTPEATMEALYQTLTGTGYDQDCNATYDETTDVLPFLASEDDPFDGLAGSAWTEELAGTGSSGGMGFRAGSRPIIVYATDNTLRDPEAGHGVPGGCPGDAGRSDVISAAITTDATLIGIMTSSWGGTTATEQMEALAIATDSIADLDLDGTDDDNLVFSWDGSSDEFSATVVAAITAAIMKADSEVMLHEEVNVITERDDAGFVSSMEPSSFSDVEVGADPSPLLRFDLTATGTLAATDATQTFSADLLLLGNEDMRIGGLPVDFVVPGTSDP